MGKTKFGILHKNTITINSTKYKIRHLKLPPNSNYCQYCCCSKQNYKDCIANLTPGYCGVTIGIQCVLKH